MARVTAHLSATPTGEVALEVNGKALGTFPDADDAIYAAGMELVHRLRDEAPPATAAARSGF